MPEPRDLTMRMHTCALNARDLDTLVAQALPDAPCFCDGEWVGEGRDAIRQLLEREFVANEDIVARVGTHRGEPAILEFDAGGAARGAVRLVDGGRGRIRELRIDHSASLVQASVPEPTA